MPVYHAPDLEAKWQKRWKESGLFKVNLENSDRPKYYNLVMFPYPSGDKLHIGHWYNYAPVDSWGRYMRMKGFDVFQPLGFDSFGLPAENYAIKTGVHPAETTRNNIETMKRQIEAMGGMYDLSLNVETSSAEYYRWTQWIFLKLYEKGLAYRKAAPVNWCDSCQTVLANEQVDDGRCERCKNPVVQKKLTQWFFKITDYAESLLNYDHLDWPEKTILMQKNWIGRSEGIEADFRIQEKPGETIRIFTTRFDTIYGTSFVAIAPEHPRLMELCTDAQQAEVAHYVELSRHKSELDRQMTRRAKTGVFTGMHAINPLNGRLLPIFVADFVLMYGTGALMGTPAHDARDFEFAGAMNLPRPQVIVAQNGDAFEEEVREWNDGLAEQGVLVNSGAHTGLTSAEAIRQMGEMMEREGWGKRTVNYRLRDWLISRQRYWGAPIPIIYCDDCGEVPVPEQQLPVVHPHVEDYIPKGQSPLASSEDFVNVPCPRCGKGAKREVDTMDTFVCSSWYFLRYPCADMHDRAWDTDRVNRWLPVDMYIGGPEHACMHLLYARFLHKAFHDMGMVSHPEPFKRLVHQGMITKDGAKMSKSKGNVVSPDAFVSRYGSDVFRMYLMFMGPFTEGGDWNDRGIAGVHRFAERFYKLMDTSSDGLGMEQVVLKTVFKAGRAIEKMNFNIAIASLMELTNAAQNTGLSQNQKEVLLKILAPLAPHLAEELWERLGHRESIFNESWPEVSEDAIQDDRVTYAVQVNGKLRATLELAADTDQDTAVNAAQALAPVQKYLAEGSIRKVIFVPKKIIGFVVG